jgi:hypothetical protein
LTIRNCMNPDVFKTWDSIFGRPTYFRRYWCYDCRMTMPCLHVEAFLSLHHSYQTPRTRGRLEKLLVAQFVEKTPTVYGTGKSNVFTRARHWTVSWVPGVLSPGVKARPGRDADHSPPSSAEVENEQELYLLSPQAPPWRVAGLLYLAWARIQMAASDHIYLPPSVLHKNLT